MLDSVTIERINKTSAIVPRLKPLNFSKFRKNGLTKDKNSATTKTNKPRAWQTVSSGGTHEGAAAIPSNF